jgi:hypothetical protein
MQILAGVLTDDDHGRTRTTGSSMRLAAASMNPSGVRQGLHVRPHIPLSGKAVRPKWMVVIVDLILIQVVRMNFMTDSPPSAPPRGTGLAFVQHWVWVADKGLMPRATALAIRAAASQILKIESDWESLDVRSLNVDGLIGRFRNVSKVAPGSLATYESRFRSGLSSYLAYLDNPASYQPKGRRPIRNDNPRSRSKTSEISDQAKAHEDSGPAATGSLQVEAARLVVYPFQVRRGVFAELKLPADLTIDEARRLGKFIEAAALTGADECTG